MNKCDIYIGENEAKYEGSYIVEDGCLEVEVFNYSSGAIDDSTAKYQQMLVVDLRNKQFMYSNKFYFCGLSYGLTQYEKFRTKFYVKTEKSESADYLKSTMQISQITIFHPMLEQCYANPCLITTFDEKETTYRIINNSEKKIINLQKNNIDKIELGGICRYIEKHNRQLVTIESEHYARIFLATPISLDNILEYINEFDVFLNAYLPTGLRSYKTHIKTIDDKAFDVFHILLENKRFHKKTVRKPVKLDFFTYLEKVYKNTNYRSTDNRNKYIPLDFKKPSSLEEQYTYYFRYIDLYMGEYIKQTTGNDANNYERLSRFVDEYFNVFDPQDITNSEKLKKELNSLRNHYIHEGYYLPNNQFAVTERRNLLYYKDMDYSWLYRVTAALKEGVFRILYTKVLDIPIDEKKLKYSLNMIK